MSKPKIKIYYKNAMAEAIGPKHGITQKQLDRILNTLPKKIRNLRSNPEIRQKEDAYRSLPYDTDMAEKIKEVAANLKSRCENLVVFGIGGSALGITALQTALKPYMHNIDDAKRTGPRLFVLDNIDPQQMTSFLKWLGRDRLRKTVFNVISRGGQTAETMSQFLTARQILRRKFGHQGYRERVVVTTTSGPDSTLYKIAGKRNDNLEHLIIPNGVGGRFSVLSAVGLFSAAMSGLDIDSLLAGACAMDKRVSRRDLCKNPAAINAAINYHFYNKGKRISVMMPYSYALKDWADWYRQLWAESLGKAKGLDGKAVHVGPTPIRALGATDQHSQVQLYREGPNDKLFTFLQVNDFSLGRERKIGQPPRCAPDQRFLAGKNFSTQLNNEKKATEYALLHDKRPCLTIAFDKVNEYTVGQFIYLYEVTTSFAGALFGINPYNQPAVDLGKEATFALMGKEGYCKLVQMPYKEFAQKIRAKTEVDEEYQA